MKHSLVRLLVVAVFLVAGLAACRGDEDGETATVVPAVLPTTAPTVAATATAAPPPTSTSLPTLTPQPLPTETATLAPTIQADSGGPSDTPGQAGQDPAAAATAAAAGQAAAMMAPWQSIMNVAVLNQGICVALQGLAQTGQQGGLGALAVGAGLLSAGGVLQAAQQQLAGLMGMAGFGPILGSLQADQASLSDLLARWSGGQLDAAGAGAALQGICGATNATVVQAQQGAQDSGIPEEQVTSMMDQSKRDMAGTLGGLP